MGTAFLGTHLTGIFYISVVDGTDIGDSRALYHLEGEGNDSTTDDEVTAG